MRLQTSSRGRRNNQRNISSSFREINRKKTGCYPSITHPSIRQYKLAGTPGTPEDFIGWLAHGDGWPHKDVYKLDRNIWCGFHFFSENDKCRTKEKYVSKIKTQEISILRRNLSKKKC